MGKIQNSICYHGSISDKLGVDKTSLIVLQEDGGLKCYFIDYQFMKIVQPPQQKTIDIRSVVSVIKRCPRKCSVNMQSLYFLIGKKSLRKNKLFNMRCI